jgi:TatD DNase family protein
MKDFLFDTHFHLDLIKDQESAGIEITENKIYTIAVTNLPDLYRKEFLNDRDCKYIKHALGFHPELICKFPKQEKLMWELLPKAKYVGEVGLDFSKDIEPQQIIFFKMLIDKIRFEKKIVTIHSRNAAEDVIKIIGNKFYFIPILHWFSGNQRDLITAIENGFYISVNHKMVNTHKFAALCKFVPKERLLLETDLPFSYNGMLQKEALLFTIEQLSKFYNVGVDNIKEQLCSNFKKVLMYSNK